MSDATIASYNCHLAALCADLRAGTVDPDDLDPGLMLQLRMYLDTNYHEVPAYAGVGSRETPKPILRQMKHIARALGYIGIPLSTGGANGADKAFLQGALDVGGPATVHIPWPKFDGLSPGTHNPPSLTIIAPAHNNRIFGDTYATHAASHHPVWDRCRPPVKSLFVRNVSILAGAYDNARSTTLPVGAVVAYTPNGRIKGRDAGATGHTLRLAKTFAIPAINLSPRTDPIDNAAALKRCPDLIAETIIDKCDDLPR